MRAPGTIHTLRSARNGEVPASGLPEDRRLDPGSAACEAAERGGPFYVELHCLTHFSFQRGASSPEELVQRAWALGYSALAITDECSVAGVVRAWQALGELTRSTPVQANDSDKDGAVPIAIPESLAALHAARAATGMAQPMQLLYGSEFRFEGQGTLVVLARDLAGWGALCTFITRCRGAAAKGAYRLPPLAVALAALTGCECLWAPARGPAAGKLNASEFIAACANQTRAEGGFHLISALLLELHGDADDALHTAALCQLAAATGLPLAAAGDVHMHVRARKRLRDVMTAIRIGRPVAQCGFALQPNAERHLRPRDRLAQVYARDWLAATLAVAARCHFRLEEVKYNYPRETVRPGLTPTQTLRQLTLEGALARYPRSRYARVPIQIWRYVAKELRLIAACQYEMFFLTVHDIVREARDRGILCQGRGSAANSVVCWCLGITAADPEKSNPLLERFISHARRNEPPDIDVDFEHERREEVIQYIYRKYGRHRAALAATVICYRTRSALRDVGMALGVDARLVEAFAKDHHWFDDGLAAHRLEELAQSVGAPAPPTLMRLWLGLTAQLIGAPRHLSQHVGGFVLTETPLHRLVPVEPAAMQGVDEWADQESADQESADQESADQDEAQDSGAAPADALAPGGAPAAAHGPSGGQAQPTLAATQAVHALDVMPSGSANDRVDCVDCVERTAAATPGDDPAEAALASWLPARPALRQVIQWEKDDLEALGMLKVDVLALGMLTAVRRCIDLVARRRGETFTRYDIQSEDKATYEMIRRADTVGTFQIESRAQMSMLPRLQPTTFYDLVVQVAIVRPGPISGGMVHPYLKARDRQRRGLSIEYERSRHDKPGAEPLLAKALKRTLGIPIFQEQVMELSMIAASFSAEQADQLRRAMAAWKRKGGLAPFQEKLAAGMQKNGYTPEFAARIFRQIQGFGEYGFPESHAYSFALIAYESAWLKCHEPEAFLAALLNSQPMGFYGPSQLIQDARRRGVQVLPPDVSVSGWDCTLEALPTTESAGPPRSTPRPGAGMAGKADLKNKQPEAPQPPTREAPETIANSSRAESRCAANKSGSDPNFPIVPSTSLGTEDRDVADAHSMPFRRFALQPSAQAATKSIANPGNVNVNVNASTRPAVRLGLRLVKGLSQSAAQRIEAARAQQPFASVDDLARRAALDTRELNALAAGDALASLAGHRRQQAWHAVSPQVGTGARPRGALPVKGAKSESRSDGAGRAPAAALAAPPHVRMPVNGQLLRDAPIHEPALALPAAPEGEDIVHDYAALGLTLRRHPLALLRGQLDRWRLKTADQLRDLPHGRRVRACGLVIGRQQPVTAKGTIFVTLEDETGPVNVIVWASVRADEAQRNALLRARLLAVEGEWQRDKDSGGHVRHLIAQRFRDLTPLLGRLAESIDSRDFH